MVQPIALAHALASPGMPHTVVCRLACEACSSIEPCAVRGIAIAADLSPLGDLTCGTCGGFDRLLLPLDLGLILARTREMVESRTALPQNGDAFFRIGAFRWIGQQFDDPRALRRAIEASVRGQSTDARAQLLAAAGMMELRDMVRALELAASAHTLASTAPDPPLFVAEVAHALGDGARCGQFARAALERLGGPMLLFDDASKIEAGAQALLSDAPGLAQAARHAAMARGDACSCGSGRRFENCCGARN